MKLKLLGILFLSFSLQFLCSSNPVPTEEQKRLDKDLTAFREAYSSSTYKNVSFQYEDNENKPVTDFHKLLVALKTSEDEDLSDVLSGYNAKQTTIAFILSEDSQGVLRHILMLANTQSSEQGFFRSYDFTKQEAFQY